MISLQSFHTPLESMKDLYSTVVLVLESKPIIEFLVDFHTSLVSHENVRLKLVKHLTAPNKKQILIIFQAKLTSSALQRTIYHCNTLEQKDRYTDQRSMIFLYSIPVLLQSAMNIKRTIRRWW